MNHDPLCPYQPKQSFNCCTPATILCRACHTTPGVPCQCDLIAKVRADERNRKGTCWREAEGSQIPSGAVRVYREAGMFWEIP